MKLFTGWMLAAALALGATAADAQMLGLSRVSDFGGPYVDVPYRGGPYYAPPPQEMPAPPPRYGYGDGYAPSALVPPHEVYNIIREAGFSPLGVPRQRGFVYTIAVIDRGGEDGRLVIDARNGRILRFVPAWQGGGYEGAWNSSYGPPGPLPPTTIRGEPRPPASIPRVASRTVPVPKANPQGSRPAEIAATRPAEARAEVQAPAAKAAEPAPLQSAAVQAKPAEAAPPPAPTAGQAKPSAQIAPTQAMPKAQGLD
jgi:hypothetical protein